MQRTRDYLDSTSRIAALSSMTEFTDRRENGALQSLLMMTLEAGYMSSIRRIQSMQRLFFSKTLLSFIHRRG